MMVRCRTESLDGGNVCRVKSTIRVSEVMLGQWCRPVGTGDITGITPVARGLGQRE